MSFDKYCNYECTGIVYRFENKELCEKIFFIENFYVSSNNFKKHYSSGKWLHQLANVFYLLISYSIVLLNISD